MNDLVAWKLAGVDDYSIAQTAAMVAVQNLTARAADITECVAGGSEAKDIIKAINEAFESVGSLKEHVMFKDFKAFCKQWRDNNQDIIKAAFEAIENER